MSLEEIEPRKAPRILIAAPVFRRLQLYIDLCPFEVGGLGSVEAFGDDLLVTSAILIRQRATGSDVELDSQAIADHLSRVPHLQKLHLQENRISRAGAKAITDALLGRTTRVDF